MGYIGSLNSDGHVYKGRLTCNFFFREACGPYIIGGPVFKHCGYPNHRLVSYVWCWYGRSGLPTGIHTWFKGRYKYIYHTSSKHTSDTLSGLDYIII